MRLPLALTLTLLTVTVPVYAIPICEPPPIHSSSCPAESKAHFYPGPTIIANDIPDEVDPCTRFLENGESSNNLFLVCETDDRAPMAQAKCLEQEDHSVVCTGWPIGNDLGHQWSHSDTLVIETGSNVKSSSVKLLCDSIEQGEITLSVWNAKGRTTVTVSDFTCTGIHGERGDGSAGDEILPCTNCGLEIPEIH